MLKENPGLPKVGITLVYGFRTATDPIEESNLGSSVPA
jgi:hypothetical protein